MHKRSSPGSEPDIVLRLRHLAKLLGVGNFDIPARLNDAADEIERLRAVAYTPFDRETLIHTICPHIKVWCDGEDVPESACQKCPAAVQTSQGEGVQMCRLNAQAAADAILALSSTQENCGGGK